MKNILVIVDMQNDFVRPEGALYVKGADSLIKKTNDFLKKLTLSDFDAILITKDTHDMAVYPNSSEGELFPPHCLKDTNGHELAINIENIDKSIPIFYMEKNVFDMWQETNPITHKNDIIKPLDFFKPIEMAHVIGVTSDYCVKDAIKGLLNLGIKVKWIDELSKEISTPSDEVAKQLNHKDLTLLKLSTYYGKTMS